MPVLSISSQSRLEVGELGVVAHHLEEAVAVDAVGAVAALEVGGEAVGRDLELAVGRHHRELVAELEAGHAVEDDEVALVAGFLEVGDAAEACRSSAAATLPCGDSSVVSSGWTRPIMPVGAERTVDHLDIARLEDVERTLRVGQQQRARQRKDRNALRAGRQGRWGASSGEQHRREEPAAAEGRGVLGAPGLEQFEQLLARAVVVPGRGRAS